MTTVRITKYFELFKDSYNQVVMEQRSPSVGGGPPRANKLNSRIVQIELDIDDSLFDVNPITVAIDMKESTKQIAAANNNIIVPVRHSIVDDSIVE